jgi:hypothetical protein
VGLYKVSSPSFRTLTSCATEDVRRHLEWVRFIIRILLSGDDAFLV